MDMRGNFSMMMVVGLLNELPEKAVEADTITIFKIHSDMWAKSKQMG